MDSSYDKEKTKRQREHAVISVFSLQKSTVVVPYKYAYNRYFICQTPVTQVLFFYTARQACQKRILGISWDRKLVRPWVLWQHLCLSNGYLSVLSHIGRWPIRCYEPHLWDAHVVSEAGSRRCLKCSLFGAISTRGKLVASLRHILAMAQSLPTVCH